MVIALQFLTAWWVVGVACLIAVPLCVWILIRSQPFRGRRWPWPLLFVLGGALLLNAAQFIIYCAPQGVLIYLLLGFPLSVAVIGWPVGMYMIWSAGGVSGGRKIGLSILLSVACLGTFWLFGPVWLLSHLAL